MNNSTDTGKAGAKRFLLDVLFGVAIGTAFIIPGFSGGSVAAILGIYERLIDAIAGIFKHFKKSILTILPFGIGMIAGIVALLFPLGWALEAYPIPTVCIFVGLAIGGLPSIADRARGKLEAKNFASFLIPTGLALALSFLPVSADANLLAEMGFFDYLLLFVIGIVGSAALVIPGISGSMLLLIFGYYNPIVALITNHLLKGEDVGASLAVLCTVGAGIAVGFFLISVIMKRLLTSCPRGTHIAILGFIIGSVPTIFISTAKEAGLAPSALMPNAWYWVASVLLFALGLALSLSLVLLSRKRTRGASD